MAWPVTSTRTVYENRWIRVDEDDVVMPDGSAGLYGVVTLRNDAVFVVAVDDEDRVLMVELDRHTVGRSLEVPAGGTDGEYPLVAARRELLEETGVEAEQWTRIGGMTALNGICRAAEHVFLARGLREAGAAGQAGVDEAGDGDGTGLGETQREEGISRVRRIPLPEVVAMASRGEITDSETLAALLLALAHTGRIRASGQAESVVPPAPLATAPKNATRSDA